MTELRVSVSRALVFCLQLSFAASAATLTLIGAGSEGPAPTLVPSGSIDASLKQVGNAVVMQFAKDSPERRFVAVECAVHAIPAGVAALTMTYRAELAGDLTLRPAVLAYEDGGGAWFRTAPPMAASAAPSTLRFSVQSLREAAFSRDEDGEISWPSVDRVWLGAVVDGTGRGAQELLAVGLTDEPFVPDRPVAFFAADPNAWQIGADKAVTHQTTAAEAANQPVLTFTFNFPGGRHMYFTPSQAIPALELSAYAGIGLDYKAPLPPGITGLLVTLQEAGGAQYYAQPAPPAADEWTRCTIPFSAFTAATWAKDANGQLDLDRVTRIVVGTHGTASGNGGEGAISIRGIEAVPAAAP